MTNRLTKEDILSFPITSFGRSIGKQLASQVVHELLGYKQLEEQIGCPLDVRVKIFTGAKVYDVNGVEYEVEYVYENEFMATDGSCNDYGIDNEYYFLFNEYNQFWWLDNGEKSE
jgi:hypothetical protein